MIRPKSRVVFDSRISKRVSEEDLSVSYKISEDELNLITKLYQAFKIKGINKAPTLETFLKELIFSNIDYFKEKCEYNTIYKEK